MSRETWRGGVAFDAASGQPLARQLAASLRQAVLNGQLGAGARLPSTRTLAVDAGVSRNTVLDAYAQLTAEGYFEGRVGSGTFVSWALPETAAAGSLRKRRRVVTPPVLSARGERIASSYQPVSDDLLRPFNPGIPALDPDLLKAWRRLVARRQRFVSTGLLNYGEIAGYRPLREAIAAYIGPSRGVRCTADQVIVTGGTQPALMLAAHVLLDPADTVWVEDPGYNVARSAFAAAGARLMPIAVDEDGMRVDVGIRRAPRARLAYVTPTHQYPLGVTMSLARRLMLVEWAGRSGGWILEDDYDSEFRYGSRPVPALQALDNAGRVVYVGTFSKVLFPALRLGYLVVPENLIDALHQAQVAFGQRAPTMEQAVLADFIGEGRFSEHVRRMRRLYEGRRAALDGEIVRRIGGAPWS